MARHAGHWLLPLASLGVVSALLTFAAAQAFAGSLLDQAASEISTASTASVALTAPEATGMRAAAGSQWVMLWSADPRTHVSCLTGRDRVSADMLYVHPEDVERLAAEVCDIGLSGASGGAHVTAR